MKEPTTCVGLYRKAIISLYLIVLLSALGGGGEDEISPYKLCVGFRSLSSSVVGLFFFHHFHNCWNQILRCARCWGWSGSPKNVGVGGFFTILF
jgi:hypothetical protein